MSVKTVGSSCGDHSFRPVTQDCCQWAPAGVASQEGPEGRYQTPQASAEIRAVGGPLGALTRPALRPLGWPTGWCQNGLGSPVRRGCERIKGLYKEGEREKERGGEVWSTFPKFPAHLLFLSFIPQNRGKQIQESEYLVISNLQLSFILPNAVYYF